MTNLSDFIYYNVELEIKTITDLKVGNKILIEFKPTNSKDLKDVTLLYVGHKANKGLFRFMHELNTQIQTYSLTLKKNKIGKDIYLTKRILMDKPSK